MAASTTQRTVAQGAAGGGTGTSGGVRSTMPVVAGTVGVTRICL